MNIAKFAIQKPLYTWLLMVFCLVAGAIGFLSVGKLEDPTFVIKQAVIITPYPGATAAEVATEITEPLESELQKMGELKNVTSRNQPGVSVITVEMKDQYGSAEIPQIWKEVRNRVDDAQANLPQGHIPSIVNDGFGDVFGLYYAIEATGFSDAEKHALAKFLRREMLAVTGVADVEIQGLPEEAIFVETPSENLVNLGVDPSIIIGAVGRANAVNPTGTMTISGQEVTIERPEGDDSVSQIASLTLGVNGNLINLADIATVSRERVEKPTHITRYNGNEVFTMAIAGLTSDNIVAVGQRVEDKFAEIDVDIPVGIQINPIYEQHKIVAAANNGFLQNLAISVGIVIGVLALFMGWRAALVVGVTLLLTVVATFFFMNIWDIKIERIALGALIIAMGMLVDNAIVVAEGMQVNMRRGKSSTEAATLVSSQTQLPLLGATVIGIMAFAGIGLSPDATGEFMFSLFAVVAISLMLSWLLAVTVTPLLAHYLFRVGGLKEGEDPYGGLFFRAYGGFLRGALRFRWLVIIALIGVTVACFAAFGSVKQQFFPSANTPLFYLNYKGAQGTSIETVSADLQKVEQWLLARDDVKAVTSTIGQGGSRFILTYDPVQPDPSFGQLIIEANSFENLIPLKEELDIFNAETLPWAEMRTQLIIYGPPVGADIEARFLGKDPDVLRELGEQASAILEANTMLNTIRTNWRERELSVQPIYATDRAQAVGVSREAVAQSLLLATDGIRAGEFREEDRLIPIIVRLPREQTESNSFLLDQLVYSPATQSYLPVSQVLDGFDVNARDTLIQRRNREQTLSVQAFTNLGVTPPTAFAQVRPLIEAIELPEGYALEWGGEFESAGQAQASLGTQMPLSFLTMFIITILLFGKMRQTFVIWAIVPMAVNGVALGLLFSNLAFSFTALLGLLSLSGMLIKNAIVLVEEIDLKKTDGLPQSEAIIAASTSRIRPVILAAGTTVLGIAPLITDPLFNSLAVTIMGGLAFGSILTLVAVPVFYHTFLRKERVAENRAARDAKLAKLRGGNNLLKPGNENAPHRVETQPLAAE